MKFFMKWNSIVALTSWEFHLTICGTRKIVFCKYHERKKKIINLKDNFPKNHMPTYPHMKNANRIFISSKHLKSVSFASKAESESGARRVLQSRHYGSLWMPLGKNGLSRSPLFRFAALSLPAITFYVYMHVYLLHYDISGGSQP